MSTVVALLFRFLGCRAMGHQWVYDPCGGRRSCRRCPADVVRVRSEWVDAKREQARLFEWRP